MKPPLFSVLIPAVPTRFESHLGLLLRHLEEQINALADPTEVEILCCLDNRRRSIGEKRDALVQISRGQFVAFCDDDDAVSEDYISSVVTAIRAASESISVITFDQMATINGVPAICQFSLRHRNEPFAQPTFKRSAWHVCAWRGDMARRVRFPATNYGEDWAWARHLVIDAQDEIRIERILHYYRFDEKISEAPPPAT